MGIISNLGDAVKAHSYGIVTSIIIAVLLAGYVGFVLPNSQAKEDNNNRTIFKGIEGQIKGYIDDHIYTVSNKGIKRGANFIKDNLFEYTTSTDVDTLQYIDTITITKSVIDERKNLLLERTIDIFNKKDNKKEGMIRDTVKINLAGFLTGISSITNFNAFYVCLVDSENKCDISKTLLSKDVSLRDQDSLRSKCRYEGPFSFKKSEKRYYADQLSVPKINRTIFLAAGVNDSYYQIRSRQINSNLLIFCLLLTIILVLSISFIKPVISSYKERLYQWDLVSVVFSIGILTAVLVVFGMVSYWNSVLNTRNQKDLEELVNHIDNSFKKQLSVYKHWEATSTPFKDTSQNVFSRIVLKKPSDTITKKAITSVTEAQIGGKSEELKLLDSYFRMDEHGLITKNISNETLGIRKKYADRNYFQMLTRDSMCAVLTGVFSRETNKSQWIYAKRPKCGKSKNNGIQGIAFRTNFTKKIKLPPGTDYMLVDKQGEVLMQNDPKKNLYQNLLLGSENNKSLIRLLSGIYPQSFSMEYQGIPYQVYARKLGVVSNFPIYIIGIRDLSYTNRLSLFIFSNGFLISILYGFFVLAVTLVYSVLLYNGRTGVFSRQHFYHLFPDNSRTCEYRLLLTVNSVSILFVLITTFFASPVIVFFCSIVLGLNTAFANLIVLNIYSIKNNERVAIVICAVIVLLSAICLPLYLLYNGHFVWAALALFTTHIGLIVFYYRKQGNKCMESDLDKLSERNIGSNRRCYTRFLTVLLLNHFAIFPFIFTGALYRNELNDFLSYYCSPEQVDRLEEKPKIINAYGCSCNPERHPYILSGANDGLISKTNLGFLRPPNTIEIQNFSIDKLKSKYYLNSSINFEGGLDKMFFYGIALLLLILLVYKLLNYYSNRFFFYELMQAAYEGYYSRIKNPYMNNNKFIPMINNDHIKKLIQQLANDQLADEVTAINALQCSEIEIKTAEAFKTRIETVFSRDIRNEIPPFLRMEFILNSNHMQFGAAYLKIWRDLPNDEIRNVLFDFAQDHFVNYKNKDILMELMELGIIVRDEITGRLRVMSLSFRIYIITMSKRDPEFIKQFQKESKNGTFSKLKFSIVILAVSFLVLLMYLNKDSYDKIALVGSSIGSALLLVDKLLVFNKTS